MRLDQASREPSVLERRCSNNGPRRPGRQRPSNGALIPEPTCDLDRDSLPHGLDDRTDLVVMRRDTRSGSIEVDDVQPPRPRRGEPSGHSRWLGSVDGLTVVIALTESHNLAAAQIDRGQDLEGRCHLHGVMLP